MSALVERTSASLTVLPASRWTADGKRVWASRDASDLTYSVLARSLGKRRENIVTTVASLEEVIHGTLKAA
jgi:hypothetical protein